MAGQTAIGMAISIELELTINLLVSQFGYINSIRGSIVHSEFIGSGASVID